MNGLGGSVQLSTRINEKYARAPPVPPPVQVLQPKKALLRGLDPRIAGRSSDGKDTALHNDGYAG